MNCRPENAVHLAFPQYAAGDLPSTAEDTRSYGLHSLLHRVWVHPRHRRMDPNAEQMGTTSLALLSRLAAATFELEMRLDSDNGLAHSTNQQEAIEGLLTAVDARELGNTELAVHVLAHMKHLVERLESAATGAASCGARLFCTCCMNLDSAEDTLGIWAIMRGTSTLNDHLAVHMYLNEANDAEGGLRAGREQRAMRAAHGELGLLFSKFIPKPPRTVAEFTQEWRAMWRSDEFKRAVRTELQQCKEAAREKMNGAAHIKLRGRLALFRRRGKNTSRSQAARTGLAVFLGLGRL